MFINKSIHKEVSIYNETLMNVFSNFTPNKLVTFDDRDPTWMNDYAKGKIKWKTSSIKYMLKMGTNVRIIFSFKRQQMECVN